MEAWLPPQAQSAFDELNMYGNVGSGAEMSEKIRAQCRGQGRGDAVLPRGPPPVSLRRCTLRARAGTLLVDASRSRAFTDQI